MVTRPIIAFLCFCVFPVSVWPAGSSLPLMDADVNLSDKPSLQRGAKLFVNYCLSCHSAKFMRYNRVAQDLGIDDELMKNNLMFATKKSGETMTVSLRSEDAAKWFGKAPPDLSVTARSRGPDWIYTFLMGFYEDNSPGRPFGVNNIVLDGTAMPAVLQGLQGVQVLAPTHGDHGTGHGTGLPELSLKSEGTMNPGQYRKAVRDLVSFLTYVGEPAKLVRYDIGTWVLLFLVGFFFLTRALKKEYWKDIH